MHSTPLPIGPAGDGGQIVSHGIRAMMNGALLRSHMNWLIDLALIVLT